MLYETIETTRTKAQISAQKKADEAAKDYLKKYKNNPKFVFFQELLKVLALLIIFIFDIVDYHLPHLLKLLSSKDLTRLTLQRSKDIFQSSLQREPKKMLRK